MTPTRSGGAGREGGVGIRVPTGWTESDPPSGVLRRLVRTSTAGARVATVTLTAIDSDGDLLVWSDEAVDALSRLPEAQIVDHANVRVGTTTSRRLLTYHLTPRGGCALETWIVPLAHRPVVLSCATSPLDYDALAPTFTALADLLAGAAAS